MFEAVSVAADSWLREARFRQLVSTPRRINPVQGRSLDLCKCPSFDLPDAFSRNREFVRKLVKRKRLRSQASRFKYLPLTSGQHIYRLVKRLLLQEALLVLHENGLGI
jgi:hypothetical protein